MYDVIIFQYILNKKIKTKNVNSFTSKIDHTLLYLILMMLFDVNNDDFFII